MTDALTESGSRECRIEVRMPGLKDRRGKESSQEGPITAWPEPHSWDKLEGKGTTECWLRLGLELEGLGRTDLENPLSLLECIGLFWNLLPEGGPDPGALVLYLLFLYNSNRTA
jgi:hypothetical protein